MADTQITLPTIDVAAVLRDSQAEIRQLVVEQVKKDFLHTMNYTLNDEVQKTVREFYDNELKEAIKAELAVHADEIKGHIANGIVQTAEGIAKALAEAATKNLAQSWQVKKLTEALFS